MSVFRCWAWFGLSAAAALAVCGADAAELRKGPYLSYGGDPTRMIVLWQASSAASTSTIEVGADEASLGPRVGVEPYGDNQYAWEAVDLQPGQAYTYRVTVDDDQAVGSFTAAPPPSATRTTFYAYGDSRSDPDKHDEVAARLLADMDEDALWRRSICLHTGDFVYVGASEEQWQDQHFSRGHPNIMRLQRELPVAAVKGNHDVGRALFGKYLPASTREGTTTYRSFDYGPVHLVFIDEYAPLGPTSKQFQWIRQDLEATDRSWKVVVMHAPAYSGGGAHGNSVLSQRLTRTLFEPLGVDLVLTGHNHLYARAVHEGVVHITTGGGGAPLQDPKVTAPHLEKVEMVHHFLRLDVDEAALSGTVIDVDGEVIDEFRIERDAARPQHGRRAVPDYDGRGDAPPTPEEAALWIPRVLLAPAWGTFEVVLHHPLHYWMTRFEREQLPMKLKYMADRRPKWAPMIIPTTLVEFGFRPSLGVYIAWDRLPFRHGRFRVHFAWGGSGWWRFKVKQRILLGPRFERDEVPSWEASQLQIFFSYKKRPDHTFYGLGVDSADDLTRFSRRQIGGGSALELRVGNLDRIEVEVQIEDNTFDHGYRSVRLPDPSIEELFDVGDPDQVPGFTGYLLGLASLGLELDSRAGSPPHGSGVRLDARAELGSDLATPGSLFARYGGKVGAFWDISGHNHLLHISQDVWLAEPLEETPIPFTEQIELGGVELMRGFPAGRYRGLSAWVTTLEYVYPIWIFLDGVVFIETGGSYGRRLDGFRPDRMSLCWGMGMRTKSIKDVSIDFLVGFGSARFDDPPFRLDEVRVVLGLNQGF